ncbi:MAG TPA: VOC family protein [Ktedonobacteraceae bacterium]
MKLNFVCLLASDVPAIVGFWRDVMQLSLTYYDEKIGYASFDTGGSTLAIYGRDAFASLVGEEPAPLLESRQMYLSFQVDDLDATYARLVEGGATPVVPPRNYPALRARQAHLNDPDGRLIEIYSPLRVDDAAGN